jgi:hypothetical protein
MRTTKTRSCDVRRRRVRQRHSPRFLGGDAIRRWVAKEIVGDRVTVESIELIEHDRQTIVRGRYDGEYDKTGLPDPLILTSYFTVRDGRIVSLIVIHNTPAY